MNLPTKITIARIALIPVMVVFYFVTIKYNINLIIAGLIFALAAFTDYLDGHLARSWNQVTDLGKFLDPIADKVLVVVTMFLVVESRIMPIAVGSILCGIIVSRELMIGALRQIAALKNVVLAADNLGKLKTVITNIALPILIVAPIDNTNILRYIGLVIFAIATIMTVVSGANYIYTNRKMFTTNAS